MKPIDPCEEPAASCTVKIENTGELNFEQLSGFTKV